VIAVVNLLLPFIDDVDGTYEYHKQIETIGDIGSLKRKITNIQYNRYKLVNGRYEERAYSVDDVNQNYELVLKTINMCSNKFFVNWVNILPMSLVTYRDSNAYKAAFKYNGRVFEGLNIYNQFKGIHLCDIYNTLNHVLFRNIYHYKWLLYEKAQKPGSRPVMYIELLDSYIPIRLLLTDLEWVELTDNQRQGIIQKWNLLLSEQRADEIKKDFVRVLLVHYNRKTNFNVDDITNLSIETIYMYLKNSLIEFSKTWYGKSIVVNGGDIKNDLGTETTGLLTYYYSYKNMYNYAKNLCVKYPERYQDFTAAQVSDFIRDLNGQTLRLTNVLEKVYGSSITPSMGDISRKIENFIKIRLIDIVFESHIMAGLYSEFVPNKLLTDYRYIGDDFDTRSAGMKKVLKGNINGYLNCYYYLTDGKYSDLVLYNAKGKTVNYFDFLLEGSSWYGYYSMDWIFQLQLYHRYLNNRVIYITGATGQGKSTQVPKLLHYAVKALGMNWNPRVVSTQPRTKPTRDNAVFIAKEMGVPIKVFSKSIGAEVRSFNNYIQYQSKDDKSIADTMSYIKEVTDGLLLQKTINKVEIDDDIVIIDEAHEHNTNMDLLLTILRHSLLSNPRLKVVITSATMDDDEAVYRNYYRCIQDTLIVDPRVHLAPPNESARYKIKDVFLTKETKDYEESETLGIQKVNELARNNKTGDILFFSIGKNQIKQIVEELNKSLPPHAIALPFYREINRDWQSIITNISSNWDMITFDRSKVFDVITGDVAPKGGFRYSQAVIVATNIAEASITIDSLKFVVDTGYYNHVYFDYRKRISVSEIIPITEMNRKQRRGRVGRKSDGFAYYMYTESSRRTVKKRYAICDEDFTDKIHDLLTACLSTKLTVSGTCGINRYEDGGFDIATVLDPNGSFYIVHPCEDLIERDPVLRTPLKFEMEKMHAFLDGAHIYKMVQGYSRGERLDNIIAANAMVKDQFTIKKISRALEKLFGENVKMLDQYSFINTLLYSYSFKCFDDVLMVIAMLLSTNYEKFLKLQRPSQSEIMQLYYLFKEFKQFVPTYSLLVDDDKRSMEQEYIRWTREYKLRGSYINMWDKIRLNKESFIRIHEKDDSYRDESLLDSRGLVKYLKGRSKSEKIELFAESFVRRYFRLLDIVNKDKQSFETNYSVIRSDRLEDNIHKSFLHGFPLNVIRVSDTKINMVSSLLKEEFPYTREHHNIMAPYGTFLYISNHPRDDNEPIILAQIQEAWVAEVTKQTGGRKYFLRAN
jgi:hypothetical protein